MNLQHIVDRLARQPHSPLFARLASEYLKTGRLADATELCESGLREHPGYFTARLILAKCRAAETNYRGALAVLASDCMPDSPVILKLRNEWEVLASPTEEESSAGTVVSAPLEGSAATPFGSGELPPDERQPPLAGGPVLEEQPALRAEAQEGISSEGRIVSKTLAEIYATQGAFGEAILTYRLLKRLRPELVPQIERRIGELVGLSQTRPAQRGIQAGNSGTEP